MGNHQQQHDQELDTQQLKRNVVKLGIYGVVYSQQNNPFELLNPCVFRQNVYLTQLCFGPLGCDPCGFWCPSFPLAWSDHGIHSPKSSADQQIARILVYPCFHVVFHPPEFCISVSMFSSFPTKKHGDVLTGWVPVTSLKKAIQRQQMSQGL